MSGDTEREAWGPLKARLAAAGFRPSRRLGQNFLLDENLTKAMVRDAQVGPGDFVLEIGPGLGFLTAPLLDAGAKVLAVEIDGRLLESLLESYGEHEGLTTIHTDALATKHTLAPEVLALLPAEGKWSLVANLPYAISAPLMVVLSELPNPPESMSVLVQLEVAERICAAAGSRNWGPISARLQAVYSVEMGRRVGPGMFWPRPKVDSAVAHLLRQPDGLAGEELARLSKLCSALFQRRRQALARVLGELVGSRDQAKALLEGLGIDSGLRAETLSLKQLRCLADSELWRGLPD
ncbi:MAG: 16S rRNA (adenine1518-N6/adenine1519-N6)-dimethyltransferase [Planctomycetota bacterium]